jgi:hypothetical protein
LLLLAPAARAQQPGPREARRGPRVYVLTMGPGDHPFARFGHNALLLEWPGRQVVYNFGTFAFDGLDGIKDFMAGRFSYWLSLSSLDRTLEFYAAMNRTLVAQELDLTLEERMKLARALAENAQPENKYYNYDYYKDNCTTRVRDAVDRALGGALARAISGTGRYTYREHTERLSADEPWLYFGLDLALGPLTDRPVRRYDELWVPGELESALAAARIERDGVRRPLVIDTRTLVTAERGPPRAAPPARVGWFGLMGIVAGGALFALGDRARTSRAARAVFGGVSALFGLFFGLIGTVLLVFWLFTKHWAAYRNENLLVCAPWAVLLSLTGIGLAFGRPRPTEHTRRLLQASAIAALLACLLALIPGFGQDNTRMAALFTPIWIGLYVGACRIAGKHPLGQKLKTTSASPVPSATAE